MAFGKQRAHLTVTGETVTRLDPTRPEYSKSLHRAVSRVGRRRQGPVVLARRFLGHAISHPRVVGASVAAGELRGWGREPQFLPPVRPLIPQPLWCQMQVLTLSARS